MQDNRTGAMIELKPDIISDLLETGHNFKQRIKDLMRDPKFVRSAGEAAGIPAEHQGPVFQIDEEVTVKSARFRVRGFEGGLLHLQGMPKKEIKQV